MNVLIVLVFVFVREIVNRLNQFSNAVYFLNSSYRFSRFCY